MSTIGGSDQPNIETQPMPRFIYIPYKAIETECQTITAELERITTEVERVAATYGHIQLPLTFLQPDEYKDNASRIVHAALLKLDATKEDISLEQWKQYHDRSVAAQSGGHTAPGNRNIHFTSDMSDVLQRLGEYVEANGVLNVAPKAFFGGEPSPRFFATVAIVHTAAWLQQQKEQAEPKS